jgi:hypothetical protein
VTHPPAGSESGPEGPAGSARPPSGDSGPGRAGPPDAPPESALAAPPPTPATGSVDRAARDFLVRWCIIMAVVAVAVGALIPLAVTSPPFP